jgi:hypothetical protein
MKSKHTISLCLLALSLQVLASDIGPAEREKVVAAASAAGLEGPQELSLTPVKPWTASFQLSAMKDAEMVELATRDPIPSSSNTSKVGLLVAKDGGCTWIHVPSKPPLSLRCGKGEEWARIQKTTRGF